MPPPATRNPVRDLIGSALVLSLLGAVYFLDPDTSLQELRAAGSLRACVPQLYPPLVTASQDQPGIDIELLGEIAKSIGVPLTVVRVSAMGQDFNPRNWRVTRAQCQVLAGGVVDSPLTRSFLDTVGPHAQTGWAIVSKSGAPDIKGKHIAVLPGISGLDRLALSQALRTAGATPIVTPDANAFAQALKDGRADAGVTERLNADRIAAENAWFVDWMPGNLPRFSVVFGLWKGDLTLKRAIAKAMDRLSRDGVEARILARYLGGKQSASATP